MERINVAELLKDCPKGMELDCVVYDNLTFDYINEEQGRIYCKVEGRDTVWFTIYGCVNHSKSSKCVIFPKGKTSWEGFQRPFVDGDIAVSNTGNPFILKFYDLLNNKVHSYCGVDVSGNFQLSSNNWTYAEIIRLATEEEKQKLFDAIKENGYKWDAETKTLEKLVEPKFKVGDRVEKKNGISVPILITGVGGEFYYSNTANSVGIFRITEQDDWGLVPTKFDISTFIPFESRVLIRDKNTEKWSPAIWGFYDSDLNFPYIVVGGDEFKMCIPYEGNQELLGTANDCDEYYKTWEE